jgi:hypothetical protein
MQAFSILKVMSVSSPQISTLVKIMKSLPVSLQERVTDPKFTIPNSHINCKAINALAFLPTNVNLASDL